MSKKLNNAALNNKQAFNNVDIPGYIIVVTRSSHPYFGNK